MRFAMVRLSNPAALRAFVNQLNKDKMAFVPLRAMASVPADFVHPMDTGPSADARRLISDKERNTPGHIDYYVPKELSGVFRTPHDKITDDMEHNTYWSYFSKVWYDYVSMYPLVAFMVFAGFLVGGITSWTLSKGDLYIDKTKKEIPWDWTRAKDNYLKANTVVFFSNRTRVPLPDVIVATQDKMIEAAKANGTR